MASTQTTIKTSPFEVRRLPKLPPEVEAKKRGKRTAYPWHELKRKNDYIEVPTKQYVSAMQSAENWAAKQNADQPDPAKHVAFSSMAATDESGNVPKQPRLDKDGNPILLKNGETSMEPVNYWIIRIK